MTTRRAVATAPARRVDLPDGPMRPRVFLAFHGTQGLLGDTDGQWPYVRRHLDGLWGNIAWVTYEHIGELTRKVTTRSLIVEHHLQAGASACAGVLGNDAMIYREVERRDPAIRFRREGAALYAADNPSCWDRLGGYAHIRDEYRRVGFPETYALFQPPNLSGNPQYPQYPLLRPGSQADVAYRTSDATVLECPVDACTDPTFGAPFVQAIRDARARGVPFIWFTGHHVGYTDRAGNPVGTRGWLGQVQQTYDHITSLGLWQPHDAVVVIDYDGDYPALPETRSDGSAADTTTGVLYWLLTQRSVTTLCTTRC